MTNTNSEIGSRVIKALNEFVDSHSKVLIHEYKLDDEAYDDLTLVRYDPNNDTAGTFYGLKYHEGMQSVKIFTPGDMFDMSELASYVKKPGEKTVELVRWKALHELFERSIKHFEVAITERYLPANETYREPEVRWHQYTAEMYENGKVVDKTSIDADCKDNPIKTLRDRL